MEAFNRTLFYYPVDSDNIQNKLTGPMIVALHMNTLLSLVGPVLHPAGGSRARSCYSWGKKTVSASQSLQQIASGGDRNKLGGLGPSAIADRLVRVEIAVPSGVADDIFPCAHATE